MRKFFVIILIIFTSGIIFWLSLDGQAFFRENEKESDEITRASFDGSKNFESKDFVLENVLPIAQYQPARKYGLADLSIPDAHASVIIDVDSGTILHYENGRERRQIASLTKMMTALLVMENVSDLDETVVIGEEEVYIEGTKIGCPRSGYCIGERLKVGEEISVESLLKAMLMNSANDAATALGKHLGGSVEGFADMMNKRARELGLEDTHFCTPSGLEIDGKENECYSSAYDIARIGAYTMNYKLIWDILKIPDATVFSSDGTCSHDIINTDLLLDEMPNCLGGKTGFTPLAGNSLLMAVKDPIGKHRVIMVVLDDPYRWQDVKTMSDWVFGAYEWR